jgi:catechol 2,3-dioxygenase-like lactoylglutathione lyase family enzyme
MAETSPYAERRRALAARYLATDVPDTHPIQTFGVDHLALICSDLEATIRFYTEVLGMRLTKIVQNRDEPTSTHIFFDMGGGNQLAFFDFPGHGPAATVRGVGSMHHVALKARPHEYRTIIDTLDAQAISYSMHGSRDSGSVYLRDPDGILLEVTTGY